LVEQDDWLLPREPGPPIQALTNYLNEQADDGWEMVFQLVTRRLFLLFWSCERVVVTLGKRNAAVRG